MSDSRPPLVLVPCDVKGVGIHPFHAVGEKYINAVANGAGCQPVLLPALGEGVDLQSLRERTDLENLLDRFDAVLLTGSVSNVDPSYYDDERRFPDEQLDRQRDQTTLEMIRVAVDMGMPLLGVCRGLQEMNVSFGGTLHQAVHDVEGLMDHREDTSLPRAEQYRPVHPVALTAGGVLSGLSETMEPSVNSLHGQGIARLAEPLRAEAVAPDGLVEAVRVEAATDFALGIQWHAEWRFWEDSFASALFAAFGDAARARAARR